MSVEQHKTYIGCVRATTDARDRAAFASRLRAAITALDLRPQGLPVQAVVCLRRLPAPWPENVLTGGALDPGRLRAWEAATVRALQTAIAHAVRPAHEVIPAGAECVVFMDRAELLACLASDRCDALALTRWWWHSLFKRRDLLDAPVNIWLRTPEYIPAALAQLARRGRLTRFAQVLTEVEARSLFDGLVACFDLRALADALADIEQIEGRDTATLHLSDAPWRVDVPESQDGELSLSKQCLLGVGLMLQRAPARLRTDGFAKSVRRPLDAHGEREAATHEPDDAAATSPPTRRSLKGNAATFGREPLMQVETRPSVSSKTETDVSVRRSNLHVSAGDDMPGDATTRAVDEWDTQSDATSNVPQTMAGAPSGEIGRETPRPASEPESINKMLSGETASSLSPDSELVSLARAKQDAACVENADELIDRTTLSPDSIEYALTPAESAAVAPETRIETRYGGLFFLINLSIFLELYGDFTAPLAQGLPLAAWDFAALLGEHLLGEEVREDAVWALLAQLAGRDADTMPGEGFAPEDEWRIPVAWIKPLSLSGGGAWRWTSANGRLQVAHPAGFPVLDVPRDLQTPEQQLTSEMRTYADQNAIKLVRVRRCCTARGHTLLARWLGRLSAYVRVRLCRAFGQRRASEAVRLLCVLPAQVIATATHVDVFMSLDDLPIEVRLAGLDRDPGWIPAAGRFLAFHFD